MEKLDKPPDNLGISGQGIHHICLTISNSGLTQEFCISPEDRDIDPVQTGPENQPVEAVILHITGPDAPEGFFEIRLQFMQVEGIAARFD